MTNTPHSHQVATIDQQEVKVRKGETILEAARNTGIYVPTLCHLEKLESFGGCRLCLVQVKQMKGFPSACTTPIEPGMDIITKTPELQKLRREILEFTLSEHPYTCLICKDKRECADFMHSTRKVSTVTGCNFCTSNGDCELQDLADYLELEDVKFPISYRGIPSVHDNPFYSLDYNLCILCGRCVRICNEERNSHVLAFVERGNSTLVGTAFGESQTEAGCEFCGACVDVCPTGSIAEKMGKWRGNPDRTVRTSCVLCSVACEMSVNSRQGDLVNIGAPPGYRTDPPQLCLKGRFLTAQIHDHPSRLTSPLINKEGRWVEVTWKEAYGIVAQNLNKHKGNRFGLIASGQDTLEDNFALQKFAREVMHSNHVDLQASYSDRTILAQIHHFITLHPPARLDAIEKAETLLILGLEASLSHPLLEHRIRKAYNKGKKVIYAHAYPTRTSLFATEEIHYPPGEEDTMVNGLLNNLHRPESVLRDSKKLLIIVGDDLLRHPSSGQIFRDLLKLYHTKNKDHMCQVLFAGYEGGHYGSVLAGVHPDHLPGFRPVEKGEEGWTSHEMIQHIKDGGVTAMMVIGDLPADPRLSELGFLVQCNMFKTEMSEYANLLLPITDFLENKGHILSMDRKMKKVNRAVDRRGMVKTITGILSGLATTMNVPGFSSDPANMYKEFRSLIKLPPGPVNSREPGDRRGGIRPDHFTYRGNRFTDLVPELQSILRLQKLKSLDPEK